MLDVYIGYDRNEHLAWEVCRQSILDHATVPVVVHRLDQVRLRDGGLYRRTWYERDGQRYDASDNKPFSTDFSFTRFLVPTLAPDRWSLFVDSDFLFMSDIAALFDLADDRYSVMCVKHDYKPADTVKMRGQVQEIYPRKNWSSLVLFNGPRNTVTPFEVNTASGQWLHGFQWLRDGEIGALPAGWNHLEGTPEPDGGVLAEHFTRGTPDMPGWEDTPYADRWRAIARTMIVNKAGAAA